MSKDVRNEQMHRHQNHTANAIELVHQHPLGEDTHVHETENGTMHWTNIIMTTEEIAEQEKEERPVKSVPSES